MIYYIFKKIITRQSTAVNTKKYILLYHLNKYKNNVELKETYFPNIIDMNYNKSKIFQWDKVIFKNIKNIKKTNIEEIINPDLKEDTTLNINNILERIMMNYDLKKWNNFDSRTILNRFYSPLTDVIKNYY